jgi:hypothetical protein
VRFEFLQEDFPLIASKTLASRLPINITIGNYAGGLPVKTKI